MRDFVMPSLGADMDAGTIVEWRVAPGAVVHRGDVVAVVETDKSELEVEVFEDAVVEAILVGPGTKVPVGTPLARLAALGAAVAPEPVAVAPEPVAVPEPVVQAEPVVAVPEPVAVPEREPVPEPVAAASHVTSPVVRHLAERLHVDTTHLTGSGPGGRVRREDVERAAAAPRRRAIRVSPRARRLAARHGLDEARLAGLAAAGRVVTGAAVLAAAGAAAAGGAAPAPAAPERAAAAPAPRSPDRAAARQAAIARQMERSWREIPHYRCAHRIDLAAALAWLDERNAAVPITERVLPAALLLKAVAVAAARHPTMNGHCVDGTFTPAGAVHLGVITALRGGGLVAPVLRDADRLGLGELMVALRELVTRARADKLRASEVDGATISVTNLGDLGVDSVDPIIHPPQVAIVGFGAVHDEPVAVDGLVGVHPVVHATLAADHRVSEGRRGAEFLATLARLLAEPASLEASREP